jgi:hypothetical protein
MGSTLGGSVLRVEMVDDTGTRFSTDISTTAELNGGAITDTWAQFTMTLEQGRVHMYVDGVEEKLFGWRDETCDDADTRCPDTSWVQTPGENACHTAVIWRRG